jgi:outer membrane protein assembly factor BamB
MHLRQTLRLSTAILFLAAFARRSDAQEWPQWRGPNRDGVADPRLSPSQWPAKLVRKWQAQVGAGHSSPIVAGTRVYTHTRQGEEEVVSSFDLNSGRTVWGDRYSAPYTINPAATAHGKGPKSTPALAGGKLYTLGIAGILSCYEAATGRILWRKDTGAQFKSSSPLYGVAMSPLVDAGAIIVHVGGHNGGALVSLDSETGRQRWAWTDDGPAYASPIVMEIDGVRQIVTQSQRNIIGVAVADGTLLWKIPFSTPYDQNAVTPVRYGNLLIVSGLDQGVVAIKLSRSSPRWNTEKVWENHDASFYMSTPVVHGDSLIGLSNRKRGQLVVLDARNGKTVWAGDGRAAENAALVLLGDTLLLLTDTAELNVFRAGATTIEPLRRYTVARTATWAHPVVTGRSILVKDADSLILWALE